MTGNTEKIQKAFREGNLFIHMFELDTGSRSAYIGPQPNVINMSGNSNSFPVLFDVLSGDRSTQYRTNEHKIYGCSVGFIGLPTTAVKEGVPVHLFTLNSRVGAMFDGNDHQHVKPLMVGSSDLYSKTENNILQYQPCEVVPKVAKIQKIKAGKLCQFPITRDVLTNMVIRAREALPEFWRHIDHVGWDKYMDSQSNASEGLNEVSIVAHIKGMRGLVVNERTHDGLPDTYDHKEYVKGLRDAKKLRDYLMERYPDVFADGIPIMSYNFTRTQQPLTEVSEEQLQDAIRQTSRPGNDAPATMQPVR